jgi:hypothetical protein
LKDRLIDALTERGATFSADAVQHAEISETGGVIEFTAAREFSLGLKAPDVEKTLSALLGKPAKIKISVGAGSAPPPAATEAPAPARDDAATGRALAHPEVQRFQQLFPGAQVRGVRDLKE